MLVFFRLCWPLFSVMSPPTRSLPKWRCVEVFKWGYCVWVGVKPFSSPSLFPITDFLQRWRSQWRVGAALVTGCVSYSASRITRVTVTLQTGPDTTAAQNLSTIVSSYTIPPDWTGLFPQFMYHVSPGWRNATSGDNWLDWSGFCVFMSQGGDWISADCLKSH